MTIFFYVVLILGFAGVEGRSLLREKKWAELVVFSLLLLAGLAILIMDSLTYTPIRVTKAIDYLFRPLYGVVKTFLLRF